MLHYEENKDVILSTMHRVSAYLDKLNAENHVACYVKEQVLKSLESNASMDYGMCAMHQALHTMIPQMTVEYHTERNTRPKIQRTSMSSLPMDRSWARPVRKTYAAMRQFAHRVTVAIAGRKQEVVYTVSK